MNKKCFVITTIGIAGSPEREHADEVFKYLIEPLLRSCGFEVTRGDQINVTGDINEQVIELLQTAHLCVADLTGQKPNVMYEVGRRHESGKPLILIMKQGEALPFDLQSTRIVFYSLDSVAALRKTEEEIKGFIDSYQAAGFQAEGAGVSLSTLADLLRRVDARIDTLNARLTGDSSLALAVGGAKRASRNPAEDFDNAMTSGDYGLATALLPQLKALFGNTMKFRDRAWFLAARGSAPAFELVKNSLNELVNNSDPKDVRFIVISAVQFACLTDTEKEHLGLIEGAVTRYIDAHGKNLESKLHASLLNQVQRLLHGAGEIKRALQLSARVLELEPSEPSFWYNSSINYSELDQWETAAEHIAECLRLNEAGGKPDEDHLIRAVKIFRKLGAVDKERDCLAKLAGMNPQKAAQLTDLLDDSSD